VKRVQVLLTYDELAKLIAEVAEVEDGKIAAVIDQPDCRMVKIQIMGIGMDHEDGTEPYVIKTMTRDREQ
jgi:hypothetical protein